MQPENKISPNCVLNDQQLKKNGSHCFFPKRGWWWEGLWPGFRAIGTRARLQTPTTSC